MNVSQHHGWDPITQADDVIETALLDANVPALMAALVHVTGDIGILDGDIHPDTDNPLDFQCGITPELQAIARSKALQALRNYRDGGCQLPLAPTPDTLGKMLHFVIGQPLSEEYVEFLSEELAIENHDPYGVPELGEIPETKRKGFHVVVIGAGMSGILSAYRLKQTGIPFTVIEKSAAVGGTWWDNVYPECRVDTPSHTYAYTFVPNEWPQYFSARPVLQTYFETCVTNFGVREHIRLGCEVERAVFDESTGKWSVEMMNREGGRETLEADAVITAVGQLNTPQLPAIRGLESFTGPAFHSARWDTSAHLEGKRVAIIGTGASAMQLMPEVAKKAAEVLLFQRNPPWIRPTDNYRDDVSPGEHWLIKHVPFYAKWYRFLMFWLVAEDMITAVRKDPEWEHQDRSVSPSNDTWRQLLTDSIEEVLSDRPDLMASAVPRYPPGAKRMLVDDGTWYAALKRDNVNVITDPIEAVTPAGLTTRNAVRHDVDVIIYATGFRANRFLWPMQIVGRGGTDLREHWGDEPRAHLGITIPGFSNLFCIYGPNTNLVVNGSAMFFSECAVRYILGCFNLMLEHGHSTLECKQDVHDSYNEAIDEGNRQMAWGAHPVMSWYKNASGRVTQNWPFTLREYWAVTRKPRAADYHLG